MSWAIVRTCRRCGLKAEKAITSREQARRAGYVLEHQFDHPDSDDGCPDCDPVLAERAKAAGIDLAGWRKAVNRARGRRPS
jgi:hypothetical protein